MLTLRAGFVQTFEKIHKQAALMLSPTQIRLVRKTDSQDDLQVFSGMGVVCRKPIHSRCIELIEYHALRIEHGL